MNLLSNVELRRVLNRDAGTAGTKKGTIIDMQNYEEATFVVAFQTVVNDSVVTVKVAHADTNSTGAMAATTATTAAITSDGTTIALSNKQIAVSVVKPLKRYLELQVVIADQNAPIDHVTAILSGPRVMPTTQGATVYTSAAFVSPATA
jgi:hypothetical protein